MAQLQATDGARHRPFSDLAHAVFGESLTIDQIFDTVMCEAAPPQDDAVATRPSLWVGSVGYERHKDSRAFAEHLANAGVERLLDVRELPISRRRGYAKTALGSTMADAGIEYVHRRALGNPKPFRDLYKSGRAAEGRARYQRYLLAEQRSALDDLATLLADKRTALMCLEHDPESCHRTVILEVLRDELGLTLDVAQIA